MPRGPRPGMSSASPGVERVGWVTGFDHLAITVADLELSCRFYADLFGAEPVREIVLDGAVAIRRLAIGRAMLSIHQRGNGVDLVARRPTVGAADFCLCWRPDLESALALLGEAGITIIAGPLDRSTAEGAPSRSIYFRDPDGNLVELMAASEEASEDARQAPGRPAERGHPRAEPSPPPATARPDRTGALEPGARPSGSSVRS